MGLRKGGGVGVKPDFSLFLPVWEGAACGVIRA
jgi:hypothetical protein